MAQHLELYYWILQLENRLVQQHYLTVFVVFHLGHLAFFIQNHRLSRLKQKLRLELGRKGNNIRFRGVIDGCGRSVDGLFDLVLGFDSEDVSDDVGGLSLPDHDVIFECFGGEEVGVEFFLAFVDERDVI